MDKDTAAVLFHQGAVFVLLDMPEGSEFGIDYNSWTTGLKFKGVKMIPPGPHYIHYCARNSLGQTGFRSGFFYNFKQKEILVKKWDACNEDIKPGQVFEEEQQRIELNIKELDGYLGAYPYENYKKWVSLTSHITEEILLKLQPECGTITSVSQFLSPANNSKMRLEALKKKSLEQENSPTNYRKEKSDGLPVLTAVPGTEIRFSAIPKQRYPQGASPQEITKHSMDSTYILDILLSKYPSNQNGILGEIQFAFICFLFGEVYDAFEQWKALVHILCTSEEGLNSHTDLFMNFISMLHFQVHEIPEDFFVDIVSADNFLTTTLREFFSNLDDGNGVVKLRYRGKKFQEHLTKKFAWDFTSEPEDFAPVIIDL